MTYFIYLCIIIQLFKSSDLKHFFIVKMVYHFVKKINNIYKKYLLFMNLYIFPITLLLCTYIATVFLISFPSLYHLSSYDYHILRWLYNKPLLLIPKPICAGQKELQTVNFMRFIIELYDTFSTVFNWFEFAAIWKLSCHR